MDAVLSDVIALREEIRRSKRRMVRWMLVMFIPTWMGTWTLFLVVLLKY